MASLSTLARAAALLLVVGGRVVAASEEVYDYVIAGGGLSGLVVANRLSEDAGGESRALALCCLHLALRLAAS
jgi:hypothetical protein